ncbi:uncharacterized protein LOC127722281 [Mytilus californianus]|uniref:uncharacterized protein LOC127722281 n=1 Tax=Mytilus californianus TaxID=6549 RepID=UPI0022453A57|nr:uncharacterized protein LOC127722281 [Mytilus californianus]
MLSRIEYIRNDVTQNCEGKLSEDLFNKYWDDIAQAVFKLVYSHGIAEGREKNLLISRLHMLSSIDLDKHKICRYIDMSGTYPATILQKIISEYCTLTEQTIEGILRSEKHYLYHKRFVTESCCVCNANDVLFCTYTKVIPERLWDIMYEWKEDIDSHICPSNLEKCCERFIPKMIDKCDLSVTVPLVLNIPDMLAFVINRLYVNFDTFLMNNKHAIYHSMEKKRCCNCVKDPTEKILFNKKEWNKLFRKEDSVSCKISPKDYCCKYSVINNIKLSNVDEILLSKICHVTGPISVLNLIGQDTFLYFLNWTVDEQALSGAITELLYVIEDETFRNDMLQRISSCNLHQLYENNVKVDVPRWISKQLQNHKATSETLFPMFVFDKDDLNVKSLQIPTDFSLPNRTK